MLLELHVPFVRIIVLRQSLQANPDIRKEGNTDSIIVDFFLQAHTALQGTAKPSHYVVILDEMKLGAEELQTITHHL